MTTSTDASDLRRRAGDLLSEHRAVEAAAILREAIRIDPSSIRAHNNLGQALLQLQSVGEAVASFETALRLDPRYSIGHNNLGLALLQQGKLEAAAESLRSAVALDHALSIAHLNLAGIYFRLRRFDHALEHYDTVVSRPPVACSVWLGRGSTLVELQRFEAALLCFDAAIATDGTCAEAHHLRAGALRALARRPEALESLERALTLDESHVEACCNRAMVLHELGEYAQAEQCYRRVVAMQPAHVQARVRLLASLIPAVPCSEPQLEAARRDFEREFDAFEAWLASHALTDDEALLVAQQQFFVLSYQEVSNEPWLSRFRRASAQRMAQFAAVDAASSRTAPLYAGSDAAASRLKLGFVSAHVSDHSVHNAILRGWLDCLDPNRFEMSVFSLSHTRDAVTQRVSSTVEHFTAGRRPVLDWARTIRERQLHALIFPEIGMNETTLALAGLRLAPRQFAAWGHPETSGLPTIDGFLSATAFEPEDAQDHYSEALIRLPNLGVHYAPYDLQADPADRGRLGVPRDTPLFICPGVPFKYRPQDDTLLVEIARRLGACTFLFFQYADGVLSHALERRLASAFLSAGLDPSRFLRTLPWQTRAGFFGVLQAADVYLDTLGFSGFNTLMQALECHLPCVTLAGRLMRGRFGSGIMQRLGMPELVASDREAYVDLAVRLGRDASYRASVRRRIMAVLHLAYRDREAIDALAALLLNSRVE